MHLSKKKKKKTQNFHSTILPFPLEC